MKYFKYLVIIVLVMFITGCDNNKESKDKFYIEYNKYNDKADYVEVELGNSKIFKYSKDLKDVIKDNAIIFIGNSDDNKARVVVNLLDKIISNTDVSVIYYSNNLDGIKDYTEDDISIPVVLFVIDGKIDSYIVNDKEELNDDEELELYNKYLNGVHKVLGDVCDEEC